MRCPICNLRINKKPLQKFVFLPYHQVYHLYHCPNCKLKWWEPLKMIPQIYEQEIFGGYDILHKGLRRAIKKEYKFFFQNLPIKSGKLLDVGCADGLFLHEAKKYGFETWGIDLDKKSILIACRNFGLKNMFAMDLFEFNNFCKKKKIKFDIITIFHVLEHQDNPKKFLKVIMNLLNKQGWIIGSVPTVNNFFPRIEKIFSKNNYPPHHFFWFSELSLKKLLSYFSPEINIIKISIQLNDFPIFFERHIWGKIKLNYNKILNKNLFIKKMPKNFYPFKFTKFIFRLMIYFPSILIFLFYFLYNKKRNVLYFQLNKNE